MKIKLTVNNLTNKILIILFFTFFISINVFSQQNLDYEEYLKLSNRKKNNIIKSIIKNDLGNQNFFKFVLAINNNERKLSYIDEFSKRLEEDKSKLGDDFYPQKLLLTFFTNDISTFYLYYDLTIELVDKYYLDLLKGGFFIYKSNKTTQNYYKGIDFLNKYLKKMNGFISYNILNPTNSRLLIITLDYIYNNYSKEISKKDYFDYLYELAENTYEKEILVKILRILGNKKNRRFKTLIKEFLNSEFIEIKAVAIISAEKNIDDIINAINQIESKSDKIKIYDTIVSFGDLEDIYILKQLYLIENNFGKGVIAELIQKYNDPKVVSTYCWMIENTVDHNLISNLYNLIYKIIDFNNKNDSYILILMENSKKIANTELVNYLIEYLSSDKYGYRKIMIELISKNYIEDYNKYLYDFFINEKYPDLVLDGTKILKNNYQKDIYERVFYKYFDDLMENKEKNKDKFMALLYGYGTLVNSSILEFLIDKSYEFDEDVLNIFKKASLELSMNQSKSLSLINLDLAKIYKFDKIINNYLLHSDKEVVSSAYKMAYELQSSKLLRNMFLAIGNYPEIEKNTQYFFKNFEKQIIDISIFEACKINHELFKSSFLFIEIIEKFKDLDINLEKYTYFVISSLDLKKEYYDKLKEMVLYFYNNIEYNSYLFFYQLSLQKENALPVFETIFKKFNKKWSPDDEINKKIFNELNAFLQNVGRIGSKDCFSFYLFFIKHEEFKYYILEVLSNLGDVYKGFDYNALFETIMKYSEEYVNDEKFQLKVLEAIGSIKHNQKESYGYSLYLKDFKEDTNYYFTINKNWSEFIDKYLLKLINSDNNKISKNAKRIFLEHPSLAHFDSFDNIWFKNNFYIYYSNLDLHQKKNIIEKITSDFAKYHDYFINGLIKNSIDKSDLKIYKNLINKEIDKYIEDIINPNLVGLYALSSDKEIFNRVYLFNTDKVLKTIKIGILNKNERQSIDIINYLYNNGIYKFDDIFELIDLSSLSDSYIEFIASIALEYTKYDFLNIVYEYYKKTNKKIPERVYFYLKQSNFTFKEFLKFYRLEKNILLHFPKIAKWLDIEKEYLINNYISDIIELDLKIILDIFNKTGNVFLTEQTFEVLFNYYSIHNNDSIGYFLLHQINHYEDYLEKFINLYFKENTGRNRKVKFLEIIDEYKIVNYLDSEDFSYSLLFELVVAGEINNSLISLLFTYYNDEFWSLFEFRYFNDFYIDKELFFIIYQDSKSKKKTYDFFKNVKMDNILIKEIMQLGINNEDKKFLLNTKVFDKILTDSELIAYFLFKIKDIPYTMTFLDKIKSWNKSMYNEIIDELYLLDEELYFIIMDREDIK